MNAKKLIATTVLTVSLLITPTVVFAHKQPPVTVYVRKVPKSDCNVGVCCSYIEAGAYGGSMCTWFRKYDGKPVIIQGSPDENGYVNGWKWAKE